MRDLNNLRELLNKATKEAAIRGCLLVSQEGLPILCSDNLDPEIEIENIAAKVASLFDEGVLFSGLPNEIVFLFPSEKIFILRIPLADRALNSMLFVTIIPNTVRYFKRSLKRIGKHIQDLLD